ncbi:MAG TPA: WYL domain-containing protein [Actinomycetota bacterium]|nr:WYL domain-containing protein [Actinomycetota bacterium]
MSSAAPGRVGRRLQRILLLLPYAIHHPGVSVDELSRKFNVPKRELVSDLELVFLCGLPGYGPGDLIDVSIDDDRVHVRMADYFSAPLRFTPAEALTLYAGAAALVDSPGMEEADALRRALDKLGRALGVSRDDAEGAEIDVRLAPAQGGHIETLEEALLSRRKVRLEYFSATRGQLTHRTVDPWGLIGALGRWYLVGWDHLSEDERMFRTDRMKDVAVLDEPADVPDDFDPEVYKNAFRERGDEATLTMEISPAVARWFGDYYHPRSSETLEDGWQRVEIAVSSTRWAATLVLQLGAGARRVDPADVLSEVRRLAREIAAPYTA